MRRAQISIRGAIAVTVEDPGADDGACVVSVGCGEGPFEERGSAEGCHDWNVLCCPVSLSSEASI